ncbi:MAG TPA: hypothetical protein VHE35_00700 [Kofleriaceae bacterium]|nr:hypothetical protein [Kofleriaceae bacterium]
MAQAPESQAPYALYPRLAPVLDKLRLAKAPVDECFNGIGQPVTYPDEHGVCATGVPKVNESYVWGLTKSGSSLWFGTASNVLCGVLYGYLEVTEPVGGAPGDDYVCERSVAANPAIGMPARTDSRVPSIYELDLTTRHLIQWAGPVNGVSGGHAKGWTTDATKLLTLTSGFRSAGSLGDTVILAGPGRSLLNQSGINVFAFDARQRTLIGYTTLVGVSNIRKWFTYDGVLYTGVGMATTMGGGGRVLRWNGPSDPLRFTQVGTTGSEIAELVVHEGRLFGASWPQHGEVEVPAGLYMSPVIPEGGLPESTADWEMVWRATDYEPDAVTATTYGTGALASFDGYLYWGTMQVPGRGALAHEDVYGEPATQQEAVANFANTLRAISIFRGQGFGLRTPPRLQVLYGASTLPGWDAETGQWVQLPTGMGPALWGPSGFGNPFNNYTWTMEVYEGSLYIGTMDWSYLAFGAQMPDWLLPYLADLPFSFGADILRIPSSRGPAVLESVNGAGNFANYGIRTMAGSPDGLFLGTANPMNLMPEGGWEIIRAIRPSTLSVAVTTPIKRRVDMEVHVQATLAPPRGNVTVVFQVTGANAQKAQAVTDDKGVARFAYIARMPGTDRIAATADVIGYGWPEDQVSATTSIFLQGRAPAVDEHADPLGYQMSGARTAPDLE